MMTEAGAPLPLSLYVHFPWCVRKCPYCDFNSHELRDELPESAYVAALIDDLEQDMEASPAGRLVSVFFGGGTPSLISPGTIGRVLAAISDRGFLDAETEVTLEANPGTLDAGRFSGFRAAGINRLSIGVQSFDDTHLARLGRIHDSRAASRAVESARRAGFDNINLDLMYGLPGQTVPEAVADVEHALSLEPEHLSLYQLTIEPNTLFHRFPPVLPDEDTIDAQSGECDERLRSAGYSRYEVSAWARPGASCVHNLNYWQFGDYLGIGAGAHAKTTSRDRSQLVRTVKRKHPDAYLAGVGDGQYVMSSRTVAPADRVFEFMLNALRLRGGATWRLFEDRTGLSRESVRAVTDEAAVRGLMVPGTLIPTALGTRFLDDLVATFIPAEKSAGAGRFGGCCPML